MTQEQPLPDNIVTKVPRVTLIKEKSKRTGNYYYQLLVTFVNGYIYKSFVNEEQAFAIKDAIKSSKEVSDNVLGVD